MEFVSLELLLPSRTCAGKSYPGQIEACYTVISFKDLCEENIAQQIKRLQNVHLPNAIQEAIQVISERQAKEIEEEEQIRQHHIKEWKADMDYILHEILSCTKERKSTVSEKSNSTILTQKLLNQASDLLTPVSLPSPSDSLAYTQSEITDLLTRLKLPTELDAVYIEQLLDNEEELMKYLPETLRPSLSLYEPVNENHPEVIKLANDTVRAVVIDPAPDVDWNTLPVYLAQAIYDAETERSEKTGGIFKYGGWVVDDIPPDASLLEKLKEFGIEPDAIVCVRDEDPEYGAIITTWDKHFSLYDDCTREELCELMEESDEIDNEDGGKVNVSHPRNEMFLSIMDLMIFPLDDNDYAAFFPILSQDIENNDDDLSATVKSEIPYRVEISDSEESTFNLSYIEDESVQTSFAQLLVPPPSIFTYESLMDIEFKGREILKKSIPESDSTRATCLDIKAVDTCTTQLESLAYFASKEYGTINLGVNYGLLESDSSSCTFIDKRISKIHEHLCSQGISDTLTSSSRSHRMNTSIIISASKPSLNMQSRVPSVRFMYCRRPSDIIPQLTSEEIQPAMDNVEKELELFDTTYQFFKEDIGDSMKPPIEINIHGKNIITILKEVLTRIQDLFSIRPEAFISESFGEEAEEEEAEEEEKVEDEKVEDENEIEPEDLGEEAVEFTPKKIKPEVHLGDTGIYCPVEFAKNFVLWPGSRKTAIIFHEKEYLLSSEDAVNKFVMSPHSYAPFSKPPKTFPSPRICIVGPSGSGKTTMANVLSKNLGLPHIDYKDFLQEKLIPEVNKKVGRTYEDSVEVPSYGEDEILHEVDIIEMVRHYLNEGTALPTEYLHEILVPLWVSKQYRTSGFILDGFPHTAEDVQFMIEKSLIPDVVIELEVNPGIASQRFLESYLEFWKQRLKEKQHKFIEEVVEHEEKREKKVKAYTLQALTKLMLESELEHMESDMEEHKPSPMGRYYVVIDEVPVFFITNEADEVEVHETVSVDVLKELKDIASTIQGKGEKPTIYDEIEVDNIVAEEEDISGINYVPEERTSLMELESTDSTEMERAKSDTNPENVMLSTSQSGEQTENFKFIPLETIMEWYESQENKEDISIEISKTVNMLFPVMMLEREWEAEEEVRERLDADIEAWIEAEFEVISVMRNSIKEHHIPWLQVDAEKNLEETVEHVTHLTSQYRYRRLSLFENTYEVTLKEAESLIKFGYYFLSKFGYWCPVQVYEKEIPVQMYLPGSKRGDIFPMIHRRYIYFILSHRLANYFGLKVITAGSALRYVLEDLSWCHLARMTDSVLREGLPVPDTLVVQALEAALMEPRCATQGAIFDGYPNTIEQCQQMAEKNMMPFLIIMLQCKQSHCIENWRGMQDDNFRNGFKYSEYYVNFMISRWSYKNTPFPPWMHKEYENFVYLQTTKSRWWLFDAAKKEIYRVMKIISFYLKNVDKAAVPLQHLCVSSQEFDVRKHSHFNNYCPVCLKKEGVLMCSKRLQRQGLVQYKKYYYWLCKDHYNTFFEKPEEYVPPINEARLPIHLPESLKLNKEELSEGQVAAGGFCVVTYLTKQPYGRLVRGSSSHAINYKGKVFLLCSSECHSEFMKSPSCYCDLEINWKVTDPLPPLQLNSLPAMGYLEQTVIPILTEALTLLTYVRPKCPTLDACTSAAIFVGLFLKIHNSKLPLDIISRYESANQRLLDTIKLIKSTLELMSLRTNMYASSKIQCLSPALSSIGKEEEEGRSKVSGDGSSASEKEKQSSESVSSGEKMGPCGYEYPIGSGDFYMGDYCMQLPYWGSSFDSLQNLN